MSTKGAKSGRTGRPQEHRLGDTLAIMSIFSQAGAIAKTEEIAQLLDMKVERTASTLERLASDHSETTSTLLPLCTTQNENEFMRIDAPGSAKFRALRLTHEQADACQDALDALGIDVSNPLRTKLEKAFFPITYKASSAGNQASKLDASISSALEVCAQSLALAKRIDSSIPSAEAPLVTFKYQGSNDQMVRTRLVVPVAIHLTNDDWVVEAFDKDSRSSRTFRASLMKDCALTKDYITIPLGAQEKPDSGTVELFCNKEATARVLNWPGAHYVSQENNLTCIEVPYFRGDWLPRHVLALGSNVSYKSERLRKEVRAIAAENLKRAKKLGVTEA